MSKVIKQMEMNDIRRTFDGVRDLVVLTTNKLSAQGEYVFRAALRKKGVRMRTVKNSLARRVFAEMKLAVPDDSPYWQKQTIFAWGRESIAELLFCLLDVVDALEIQPKIRPVPAQLAEPKRHGRSDGRPLAQNVVERLARYAEQPGNLGLRFAERRQNVFPQQFTGMHGGKPALDRLRVRQW